VFITPDMVVIPGVTLGMSPPNQSDIPNKAKHTRIYYQGNHSVVNLDVLPQQQYKVGLNHQVVPPYVSVSYTTDHST
jgi:hypothetical protein